MDEIAARFNDLYDLRTNGDGGNRQVTRRQPFGHRDDVRLDAHGFVAPYITRPAKAADNLVTDQQYAIVPTNRFNLWPVICRRNDDAARALYRLTNEGSDIFRTDL